MTNPENQIVSEAEAAKRLGLSPRTMQRLRADRVGPRFVQLTDRRIGYRIRDLDAWTQARASGPEAA